MKITPPEAHFTGSAFGKGIYFSDSASKSARYCNGAELILLCEVAAGFTDIRNYFDDKPLINFCESLQAIGQFYPHPLYICPDGLKIPNGDLVRRSEHTGLIFNEFVVFYESRVKIRYLIKLKTLGFISQISRGIRSNLPKIGFSNFNQATTSNQSPSQSNQ